MKKVIPVFLVLLALTGVISACNFKTGGGNVPAISSAAKNENPVRNNAIEESIAQTSDRTGTYYYKSGGRLNVMEVEETGKDSLRAAFGGIYEYKRGGEWMQDAGATGVITARLDDDQAELRLEDYPDCRINLKFQSGKLIVRQKERCGFGGNVTTGGVYVKLKNAVPRFDRKFNQEEFDQLPDTPFNAGQLRFSKGATETTVSGEITETQDEAAYIFTARKGQILRVSVLADGASAEPDFYFIAPVGSNMTGERDSRGWVSELPVGGNYKIVVHGNGNKPFRYKMRVSIK